jgi:hypothetical protein
VAVVESSAEVNAVVLDAAGSAHWRGAQYTIEQSHTLAQDLRTKGPLS